VAEHDTRAATFLLLDDISAHMEPNTKSFVERLAGSEGTGVSGVDEVKLTDDDRVGVIFDEDSLVGVNMAKMRLVLTNWGESVLMTTASAWLSKTKTAVFSTTRSAQAVLANDSGLLGFVVNRTGNLHRRQSKQNRLALSRAGATKAGDLLATTSAKLMTLAAKTELACLTCSNGISNSRKS